MPDGWPGWSCTSRQLSHARPSSTSRIDREGMRLASFDHAITLAPMRTELPHRLVNLHRDAPQSVSREGQSMP